nr:hemerythrin domain-containing protein [Aurantimonas marianensis]
MRSRAQARRATGRGAASLRSVGAGAFIGGESLVVRLNGHFSVLSDLCDRLEEIADRLPDKVNRQDALHVARSVSPTVRRAHDFEETVLFPLLKSRFATDAAIGEALNDLRFEHWEDEMFAEELAEGLVGFIGGLEPRNPEALGYMLRGFFGGMRRHITFEKAHIVPLVQQIEGGGHA